jgi:hypothetical protein
LQSVVFSLEVAKYEETVNLKNSSQLQVVLLLFGTILVMFLSRNNVSCNNRSRFCPPSQGEVQHSCYPTY